MQKMFHTAGVYSCDPFLTEMGS